MKGLLIKDFKLMKNQRLFFAILVGIAVGMAILQKDSASFVVGYLSFICTSFTVSTISYDEFDNGYAFLFCLPITRKEYVAEKYGFGLLIGVCSWLLGTIVAVVSDFIYSRTVVLDTFMIALLIFPVVLLIMSMMLPVQLKFGGEKGGSASLIAVGLVLVVGVVLIKIMRVSHIDLISIINNLPIMNIGMLAGLGICFALVLLLISYKISLAIMKRKEF